MISAVLRLIIKHQYQMLNALTFSETLILRVYSWQSPALQALAVSWGDAAKGDAGGQILLTFIELLQVTGS